MVIAAVVDLEIVFLSNVRENEKVKRHLPNEIFSFQPNTQFPFFPRILSNIVDDRADSIKTENTSFCRSCCTPASAVLSMRDYPAALKMPTRLPNLFADAFTFSVFNKIDTFNFPIKFARNVVFKSN